MKARFKVGQIVQVAKSCDNENYDSFRGKPLEVTRVSTSERDHPGYDPAVNEPLYDFEGIPVSLYEYELAPHPRNAFRTGSFS